MRFGSGLFALALGLRAVPALAANCTFEPFSTVPGADLTTLWTVKSGHPCDVTLRVGDGIGVSSMTVVEPAAGGVASTPTLNDRFVVERTAEGMARRVLRGVAHWTVEIDVVP